MSPNEDGIELLHWTHLFWLHRSTLCYLSTAAFMSLNSFRIIWTICRGLFTSENMSQPLHRWFPSSSHQNKCPNLSDLTHLFSISTYNLNPYGHALGSVRFTTVTTQEVTPVPRVFCSVYQLCLLELKVKTWSGFHCTLWEYHQMFTSAVLSEQNVTLQWGKWLSAAIQVRYWDRRNWYLAECMRSKYQGHVLNVMHLMRSASLPFFFDDQTPFFSGTRHSRGGSCSQCSACFTFIYLFFVCVGRCTFREAGCPNQILKAYTSIAGF